MIAGLSESSAIHRQISDVPLLTYTLLNDQQRTNINLQQELDSESSGDTSAVQHQTAMITEVTSTGTNTIDDMIVTEDQATETG